MQKWEYHAVQLSLAPAKVDETLSRINYLGEQGWELVATVSDQFGAYPRLFFKRPEDEKPATLPPIRK